MSHSPTATGRESAALAAVLALHSRDVAVAVAVDDGTGWQDIEPDTFEDITGREVICNSCLKPWPCATVQAIQTTGYEVSNAQ